MFNHLLIFICFNSHLQLNTGGTINWFLAMGIIWVILNYGKQWSKGDVIPKGVPNNWTWYLSKSCCTGCWEHWKDKTLEWSEDENLLEKQENKWSVWTPTHRTFLSWYLLGVHIRQKLMTMKRSRWGPSAPIM